MALGFKNTKWHDMPQFKGLSGGPKKLPDVPIDYLPAGGSDGVKSIRPNKEGYRAYRSGASVSKKNHEG